MFRAKTVLIIGAGASKEAGLPVGEDLTAQIQTKYTSAPEIGDIRDEAIRNAFLFDVKIARPDRTPIYDYPDLIRAALQIQKGMGLAGSIDAYMDVHREDPRIQIAGKLAIVRAIMEAEKSSRLLNPRAHGRPSLRMEFSALKGTWYGRLFKVISEGIGRNRIGSLFENLSVVSFNYDRCLEHFLTEAIKAFYNVSEEEALATQQKLPIFHPYGSVGPWHDGALHQPFGDTIERPDELLALAARVRTFTERLSETAELKQMRKEISSATQLVFLGFAYHAQNMEILGPDPEQRRTRRIYGTALKRSAPDKSAIEAALNDFLDPLARSFEESPISLLDGEAHRLCDEYALALMAE